MLLMGYRSGRHPNPLSLTWAVDLFLLPQRCSLVAALLSDGSELFICTFLFGQRLRQKVCGVRHAQMFCHCDERAVGRNFIMLDLLAGSDECSIQNFPFLDFIKQFLAFLDETFHRDAFHAFQLQTRLFDQLIDPLNLTLGFFKVRGKGFSQFRICGCTGQFGQRFGDLFFCAVYVRKLVYEQIIYGRSSHVGILVR
jgi:hypothetical protein